MQTVPDFKAESTVILSNDRQYVQNCEYYSKYLIRVLQNFKSHFENNKNKSPFHFSDDEIRKFNDYLASFVIEISDCTNYFIEANKQYEGEEKIEVFQEVRARLLYLAQVDFKYITKWFADNKIPYESDKVVDIGSIMFPCVGK